MEVMVVGSNGQLGVDLMRVFPEAIPMTHRDLEIRDRGLVVEVLKDYQPNVVINTAAFHWVDKCETEVEEAVQTNVLGVRNLAMVCRELGAKLVHVSTDYVFGEGRGPHSEREKPCPRNFYAITKLAGEHTVQAYCEDWMIVRTSGLYGVAGCRARGGGNFVESIISLQGRERIQVVDDCIISPTYTLDLAERVKVLVDKDVQGIFHVVNDGSCTWKRFAEQIFAYLGQGPVIEPARSADRDLAKRPSDCSLISRRTLALGLTPLRHWRKALLAYLIERGYLKEEHP